MNADQEDQLSMEIVVESFVSKTPATTLVKLPGIVQVNTAFGANVEILRAFRNGQDLNRTGYRKSKDSLREEMSQLGFTTAAQVCAYAIAIEDEVLQMKVTYVFSDLSHMRDTEVADACDKIHTFALEHLANLADYDVTEDSLNKLKDSIILYNEMLPQTREGIMEQSSFTKRIKELFADNQVFLFRMDKLVTMLKFTNPTYYSDYFSARKIVNTGHRKQALRGKITNELGQPIDKVYITIEAPKEVTVKSTAKGNYQFKAIEGGVWPVTFTRNGYETIREYIVFTPTLRVDLNVTLKALAAEQQKTA